MIGLCNRIERTHCTTTLSFNVSSVEVCACADDGLVNEKEEEEEVKNSSVNAIQ